MTEQLDGSPESIILESILEAMAEYYSKNLAREVTKGLRENAKTAIHTGGVPPLGYDLIVKKLVVNQREAQAVRLIFEMYAQGHSYGDIITLLNQNGYVTRRGNPFAKNSLFEILRNEKYRSVFVYNKSAAKSPSGTYNRHAYKPDDEIIRVQGSCPAIVSDEVFEAVAKRQKENQKKLQNHRGRQKYLLSGLVFCGSCNVPMYANRRRKDCQTTFRCSQHGKSNCQCKEINMAVLEEQVLQTLKDNIFSYRRVPDIMQAISKFTGNSRQEQYRKATEIELQLKEVCQTKTNILKAVESGISASHFGARLDELGLQEEQLRAELVIASQPQNFHVTEKDVRLLINRFQFMVKERDVAGLRKIMLNFVKRITVINGRVEVSLKISFGDIQIENPPLITTIA